MGEAEQPASAVFETKLRKSLSEPFNTAVFRFIELRTGSSGNALVKLETRPLGEFEQKVVTFGSADAAREFATYWSGYPKRAPSVFTS